MKLLRACICMIVLTLYCGLPAWSGTDALDPQTVELQQAMHFSSPDGEDVLVPAGSYTLDTAEKALQLTPQAEGVSMVIGAKHEQHHESLSEPMARWESGENDSYRLSLQLPDGNMWSAVGSASGLSSRFIPIFPMPQEPEHLEFEPMCIRSKPKEHKKAHRTCSNPKGKKNIAQCKKWLPTRSNKCTAMENRSLPINFEYFGDVDCRALTKKKKHKFTMIVIHNGGHARLNTRTWQCRVAAAHYTINRDGTVYQHLGEEFRGRHVVGYNDKSIGIELETKLKFKKEKIRCNSMGRKKLKQLAKKYKITRGDIVKDLCAPSAAQYQSLKKLIADIKARHPIAKGEKGVVGHCELVSKKSKSGHGDPRAFDWRQVGLSNAVKLKSVKDNKKACRWYDLY